VTDLRLVLLVAGVLVIAVIWFLEARRERVARRQHTILRRGPDLKPGRPGAPAADAEPPPDAACLPPISPRPDVADPGTDPGPNPNPAFIALLVLAPDGAPFSQSRIFAAAESAGLRFDAREVFTMPAPDGDAPLFSVANMHEPGTFSRDAGMRPSRGVALIMRVPPPAGPQRAFDLMLDTARLLAESLGGTLHDAGRRPLDDACIATLRRQAAGAGP
jgi:cell division protein ZipA